MECISITPPGASPNDGSRSLVLFSRRVAMPLMQQICSSSLPSDVRRNSRESGRVSRYYRSSFTPLKPKITTRLEREFQRELQITITGLTCDPALSRSVSQKTLAKTYLLLFETCRRPRGHREPCRSRMPCLSLPSIRLTVGNFFPDIDFS